MIVVIPDHFAPNVGGAMVERATRLVNEQNMVPAFLHQYAEMWNQGVRYGGSDTDFWTACYANGAKAAVLRKAGLIA